MITKETKWMTYEGVVKPLNQLEDTHLANIIHHVDVNNYPNKFEIMNVCSEILKDRGISFDFVRFTQIPHKNRRGKWAYWDNKKGKPVELQH